MARTYGTTSPEVKADLVTRLHRIEGQVRGVEKMVQEERDCGAILQQMSAIRSAVHHASLVLRAPTRSAACWSRPTAKRMPCWTS